MGRVASETPTTPQEYLRWHQEVLGADIKSDLRYFGVVAPAMQRGFEESKFWGEVCRLRAEWAQGYLDRTEYELWAFEEPPALVYKSTESFQLKVFRKNVLENRRFPEPPDGGWYEPSNWFARTNDIVRTCFVVRYLDGVEEVCDQVRRVAEKHGYEVTTSFEAREEGYYAAHMSLGGFDFRVPSRKWDYTGLTAPVEMQVTTQVKDVIRDLTHRFYEQRRLRPPGSSRQWQWEYRSDEFSANYLGHTLHYLEGTIMDIRDRAKKGGA